MIFGLTVLLWLSVIVALVFLSLWLDERLLSLRNDLKKAMENKPTHTIERHFHIQHKETVNDVTKEEERNYSQLDDGKIQYD